MQHIHNKPKPKHTRETTQLKKTKYNTRTTHTQHNTIQYNKTKYKAGYDQVPPHWQAQPMVLKDSEYCNKVITALRNMNM